MFERYTEKARRVIFFSRYEASMFGSPQIESQHLLLGLIREDKTLIYGFLTPEDAENIRRAIEARFKPSGNVMSGDLPLSPECKQILANAAEQATQRSDPHIGTEHLLLALLGTKTSFPAELLTQRGVTTKRVLKNLKKLASPQRPKTPPSSPPPPWSWPDAT